ncbi:MAG: hypothetical protein AAGA67_12395 [Cyanobacteria bacterium P01_F01_bin.153]
MKRFRILSGRYRGYLSNWDRFASDQRRRARTIRRVFKTPA